MSRLRGRVDKLEKVRADRQHLLAEPYPAHTKGPIHYEAVSAVLEELIETAPMGKEAVLDLMLSSIPKCMRRPYSIEDRHPNHWTAKSNADEENTTA